MVAVVNGGQAYCEQKVITENLLCHSIVDAENDVIFLTRLRSSLHKIKIVTKM